MIQPAVDARLFAALASNKTNGYSRWRQLSGEPFLWLENSHRYFMSLADVFNARIKPDSRPRDRGSELP
jgi:hypothetical protein